MKNKKTKKTKQKLEIEDGLFFKEDFEKLPAGTIIYIKSGLVIPTNRRHIMNNIM